jgi:hypothetical protein
VKFKMNRYRYYILIQAFVIVAVMLTFKVIESRQIASLVASTIFICTSLGIILFEFQKGWRFMSAAFWSTTIFFIFLVLPIFILRILNWDVPFAEIEMMGVKPELLHKLSNQFFTVVLFSYFIDSFRYTRLQIK